MVDEFEDGKSVEDYVKELDSLELESEPFPEGQPLENVVEVIEKPQKKPDAPKKKQPPTPQVVEAPAPKVVEPPPEPVVTEAPVEQAPATEEPKPQFYSGIDDFIQKQSERIEVEYVNQGKLASQQFKEAAYQNLVAVVTGRVRLVPVEQPQPTPQPQPAQEQNEPDVTNAIRQIDGMLKDPAFKASRKALLKRKCELLGVDFTDDLTPAEPTPAPTIPNPIPLPQPKPKKNRLNPKIYAAFIGIVALVAAGVIILVNALT